MKRADVYIASTLVGLAIACAVAMIWISITHPGEASCRAGMMAGKVFEVECEAAQGGK